MEALCEAAEVSLCAAYQAGIDFNAAEQRVLNLVQTCQVADVGLEVAG
jgi:hypothetical protein